jgi:hypothetical protein
MFAKGNMGPGFSRDDGYKKKPDRDVRFVRMAHARPGMTGTNFTGPRRSPELRCSARFRAPIRSIPFP